MYRLSLPARRKTRGGFASKFAMAVALASGAAVGMTGLASPAYAQKKGEAPQADYSEGFVEAYRPVAEIVNAEGGDYAAAKAQIPAVVAAAQTADDKNAAGQLALQLGSKLEDLPLQRQGLELSLASGKVPPERVGQYQYFIGSLAYEAKDYAAARQALLAAISAGHTQDDPEALVIESYFHENRAQEGIDYLKKVVEARRSAGRAVSDNWLLRGLKVAYENKLTQQANDLSALLVATNPTEKNLTNAIQVVRVLNNFDDQGSLDLLRLMRMAGTLGDTEDYAQYIAAADARRNANEVLAVIQEGTAAGLIPADDAFFNEQKRIAEARAPADREEVPELVAEAKSANTGVTAMGVADAFMSFDDFSNAEQMYQVALEKGVQDRQLALVRLGIAQARQSRFAEARQTFSQVAGPRAPIAEMWSAWAGAQSGSASRGG